MRKKVGGRQVPGHTVGMKKKSPRPPTRSKLSVLRQLCHHIPPHLVAQLARDLGTEKLARTCSHWSHVVALLYAQLVHAISLNDVCDSLRLHSGPLSALRGATPPSKNGLSHANKERDPALAEALFWKMLSAPARSLSGAGRTRGPPVGRTLHPERLRRVVALVEVDGKEVEMTFLTNHLEWAAASVVALYKCRWQIEVFFKQIKQTLQLADFLGNSARAVRWQVWTALLVYVLLRYLAAVSQWSHSFARLWAVTRAALWLRLECGGAAQKLWDSGRELPDAGRARTGVFAGPGVNLWDSRRRGQAAPSLAP